MNHLSLFSGIGGLDLAAEWAGFETVAFVERDPYCQRVLAKRWPGVPILDDVRAVSYATLNRRAIGGNGHEDGDADPAEGQPVRDEPVGVGAIGGAGRIAVVSGGFPCQPHSVAGKRQASADDRDLWPEVARVLREIRPRWFVGENVRGLLHSESGRFFGSILGDLADLGYRVGWGVWGASDVGALHQRERVFIVAYADDAGPQGRDGAILPERAGERTARACGASAANEPDEGWALHDPMRGRHGGEGGEVCPGWDGPFSASGWSSEPDVGRVAHGVPSRVDRLRALGNAAVPQQAYVLFRQIAEIEGVKQHSSNDSPEPK